MANSYEVIQQEIVSALTGRPAGTQIQPENHQQFALDLLDYIHSVEIIGASSLQGNANTNTVPIQPENARVSYISSVPPGQTYVYTNFLDENGQPISVTSTANTVSLITLLWNGSFWSVIVVVVQLAIDYSNGYLFMGMAEPTTNPGTPDQNVFYIASETGTYTNFGGLAVADGEVAILRYNGSWQKEITGAGTAEKVAKLEKKEIHIPVTYSMQYGIVQAYSGKMSSGSVSYRMAYFVATKNCKITITYKRTSNNSYNGRYGIVASLSALEIGQTVDFIGRFSQDQHITYNTTLDQQ